MQEAGKTLHICNGESALHQLTAAKINGTYSVWNEMLCEGPLHPQILSKEFLKIRKAFFKSRYQISESEYNEKTISHFKLITNFNEYPKLVLWFEYDLFCQVNLIALLSYLLNNWLGKNKIFLVCVGKFDFSDKLLGLGELDHKMFPDLLLKAIQLNKSDLQYANDFWLTYCKDQHTVKDNETFPLRRKLQFENSKFPYLIPALKAHFRRKISKKNELNEIESKIKDLLNSGIKSDKAIVKALLEWQEWYGFGDIQYLKLIEEYKTKYSF